MIRDGDGDDLSRDASALFDDARSPPQLAVGCDTGIGKSDATMRAIVGRLRDDPDFTAAYLVPVHRLGEDVAGRLDGIAGEPVAGVYRGRAQPDPADPRHRMCRRHGEAEEIERIGGDLRSLCGGPRHRHGCCGHHPDHPRRTGPACAYVPQRRRRSRLWVGAQHLLTHAVPTNLRREPRPAFDLVVIDEADLLGVFLKGTDAPCHVALGELGELADQGEATCKADDLELPGLFATLRRMGDVLKTAPDGPLSRETVDALVARRTVGFDRAWRLAYRLRENVDALIRPDMTPQDVAGLGQLAGRNRLVFKVVRLLKLLERREGRPEGAAEAIERRPVRHPRLGIDVPGLALRWREDIHRSWLESPFLVLDATLEADVLRELLPRLRVLGEARARVRHAALVQMTDAEWSMRSLNRDGADARINRRLLANVLRALAARTRQRSPGAHDVLCVAPKKARALLEDGAPPLPARVALLHFGSERGLDGFGRVAVLVVAGRLQIPPAAAELTAAIWFDRPVAKLASGEPYPVRRVDPLVKPADRLGRLPDGLRPIGRPAHELEKNELALPQRHHPDPLVEAVRRSRTENALLQAIGRCRAVNRTADDPVVVLLLTNTPLPLEVDFVVRRAQLDGIADATALLADRAAPLVPAHRGALAALFPDLWANDQAVGRAVRADPDLREALEAIRAYRALALPDGEVCRAGFVHGTDRNGRKRTIAVALHPRASQAEQARAAATVAAAAGLRDHALAERAPPPDQSPGEGRAEDARSPALGERSRRSGLAESDHDGESATAPDNGRSARR